MLSITNNKSLRVSEISFQAHLPRKFSSMMNYLYKNTPDIFECQNSMRVSTILDNGEEVFCTVNFLNGKYHGLIMDEGYEHLAQEFKRTALKRYCSNIMKKELKDGQNIDKKKVKYPTKCQLIETYGANSHVTKWQKLNELKYQRHIVKKLDYKI